MHESTKPTRAKRARPKHRCVSGSVGGAGLGEAAHLHVEAGVVSLAEQVGVRPPVLPVRRGEASPPPQVGWVQPPLAPARVHLRAFVVAGWARIRLCAQPEVSQNTPSTKTQHQCANADKMISSASEQQKMSTRPALLPTTKGLRLR